MYYLDRGSIVCRKCADKEKDRLDYEGCLHPEVIVTGPHDDDGDLGHTCSECGVYFSPLEHV